MIKSLFAIVKSHSQANASARQIARLTDRELDDVGASRFDDELLSKARRYRSRETETFTRAVGAFSFPTA